MEENPSDMVLHLMDLTGTTVLPVSENHTVDDFNSLHVISRNQVRGSEEPRTQQD